MLCLAAVIHHPTLAESGPTSSSSPGRDSRELVSDPHFQRGFTLLAPSPGQISPYGKLQSATDLNDPLWELAQWSSKHRLDPTGAVRSNLNVVRWENFAKSVTLAPRLSPAADLALGVNGSVEYGDRARKSGEPWVHLLVEQSFTKPPALTELTEARLHIETRLLRSKRIQTKDHSPNLHAAQFQIFFTIQNLRRDSTGYGKYLWFGVALYDSRYRIPIAHKSQDTGGTDRFIFTPAGDSFTAQSAHDWEWVAIDKNLLPLMREAVATAWQQGFLTESRQSADYHITGINLGWEITGIFDVEMQVRNLSLQVAL